MTRFIASVFLFPNRVSFPEAFEALSRMTGNCHVRFLEGRTPAMGSGYSISCGIKTRIFKLIE
jgi:hypothetical protein